MRKGLVAGFFEGEGSGGGAIRLYFRYIGRATQIKLFTSKLNSYKSRADSGGFPDICSAFLFSSGAGEREKVGECGVLLESYPRGVSQVFTQVIFLIGTC